MYKITDFTNDPSLGTGSQAAFELARRWLHRCKTQHWDRNGGRSNHCPAPSAYESVLPTRVIDVGSRTAAPFLLLSGGKRGSYCALSYCWGNAAFLRTTRSTLGDHLRGIPMDKLPRTLKEAILAARELGFRYIWIDSLCIIQDDIDDWRREAAAMHTVYSNAVLTIAALSSTDANDGLFRSRKSWVRPVQLTFRAMGYSGKSCAYAMPVSGIRTPERKGPLNSRGWTLQEEILSPRILYFGDGMLFWDCFTTRGSEADPDGTRESARVKQDMLTACRRAFGDVPLHAEHRSEYWTEEDEANYVAREQEIPFMVWEGTVAEYSTRELTYSTDTIAAIQGLATRMEPLLQDSFLCGIWTGHNSLRSLCWESLQPGVRRSGYPSWSWASTTSSVAYTLLARNPITWHAEVFRVDADRKAITIRGPMRKGDLKLFGWPNRKTRWMQRNREYPAPGPDNTFSDQLSRVSHHLKMHRIKNSIALDSEAAPPHDWRFLAIATLGKERTQGDVQVYAGKLGRNRGPPGVICLCLAPADKDGLEFERVGACEMEDCASFWDQVTWNCEATVI
jgi:hypothetical protein